MANCFRQFVCLIDDQCLVVFQQGLPPVLPVGCICQQVIVIADLNGNRCTVGIFQILSIPAIGVQDAAAAATLRNTDQTAIMTRYSRQKIQVQALVGSAQGSCTPGNRSPRMPICFCRIKSRRSQAKRSFPFLSTAQSTAQIGF